MVVRSGQVDMTEQHSHHGGDVGYRVMQVMVDVVHEQMVIGVNGCIK